MTTHDLIVLIVGLTLGSSAHALMVMHVLNRSKSLR